MNMYVKEAMCMENVDMNLKENYIGLVSMRLRDAMRDRNLKQRDVLARAQQFERPLRQSALSKLMSGKLSNIPVLELATVCELLNLDMNEVLSTNPKTKVTMTETDPYSASRESMELIRDPKDWKIQPYLGSYYTWFFSTKDSETHLLKGRLIFEASADKKRTLASFSFKTGKTDGTGREIVKEYQGELMLSPAQYAAYCILQNDQIGEISFLTFKYNSILYEKLKHSVGMVLTSSAGLNRMPTAHRMLISAEDVSDERMEVLKGQLYMNEPDIMISEKAMERFWTYWEAHGLSPAFAEYFRPESGNSQLLGVAPTPYYCFNESMIRYAILDEQDKLDGLHLLRQFSVSPRNHKLGSSEELLSMSLELDEERKKGTIG